MNRNFIFFLIAGYVVRPSTAQTMKTANTKNKDLAILSKLNAQFIQNYIHMDTVAHNKIIHKDFICIDNTGVILNREDYMKDWSHSYKEGGFISFGYQDEYIRIFGDLALVRSRSVYTKIKNGENISGASVYTDTYIKVKGRWWCVQAQITPEE